MYFGDSNEENGSNTNQNVNLKDDFKRLLVRRMAKAIKRTKSDRLIFKRLQTDLSEDCKKLGKNCKEIWTQMVSSTTKKLKNLLKANDLLKQSNTTMQLSEIEWLLFDLVLVTQNIYAADIKKMPECVKELYRLIQRHDIENLMGDKLAEAWIRLTLEYNKRGRMVSPMLLQQRWYQLKELARKKVHNKVVGLNRDTIKVLHSIVIKYQKIITKPFPTWQSLIKRKCVILPEQFVEFLSHENKWKLKAHELWYLEINRELHDSQTSKIEKNNKDVGNSIPITINSDIQVGNESCNQTINLSSLDLPQVQRDNEPLLQLKSEKVQQSVVDVPEPADLPKDQRDSEPLIHVKSEEMEQSVVDISKPADWPKDQRDNELLKRVKLEELKQSVADIPKPADWPKDQRDNELLIRVKLEEVNQSIADIPKPADLPKDQRDSEPLIHVKSEEMEQSIVDISKTANLPKDQSDNRHMQVKSKEKEQYLLDSLKPMSKTKDVPLQMDEKDTDKLENISQKILNGLTDSIIRNTTEDIQDKSNKDTAVVKRVTKKESEKLKKKIHLVVEKNDFLNKDIELIDVNKRKGQKKLCNTARQSYNNDGNTKKKCIDNDPKLRMKAIVSTKKLDTMKVFKVVAYDVVKDKKVIENALLESIPILERVLRDKNDGVVQVTTRSGHKRRNNQIIDDTIRNANETANKSLKSSSCLFRKSKRRRYNKELQKNPDFNTEVKKLTQEFMSSASNKILLEKCIPLTIDVCNDFEKKLTNGRYTIKDVKKNTITNAKVTKKVFNTNEMKNEISKEIVKNREDGNKSSQRTGNSKINNLTKVDLIRKINQSSFAAEIKPISNHSLNKQPKIKPTRSRRSHRGKTSHYISKK